MERKIANHALTEDVCSTLSSRDKALINALKAVRAEPDRAKRRKLEIEFAQVLGLSYPHAGLPDIIGLRTLGLDNDFSNLTSQERTPWETLMPIEVEQQIPIRRRQRRTFSKSEG